jgi:hypothetical protein
MALAGVERAVGAIEQQMPGVVGRIARRLAARGCRVVGLDASADFLRLARADAAESGVEVDYVQGDLRPAVPAALRPGDQLVYVVRLLRRRGRTAARWPASTARSYRGARSSWRR